MAERGVAVGLNVFKPDRSLFDPLLELARREAAHVFIVVDGLLGEAIDPGHLRAISALSDVSILQLRENAGIASGLNRLVAAARAAGFSRLIFFDQDSEPGENLIARLDRRMVELLDAGHHPAMIGPCPVAAAGSGTRAPRYRRRGRFADDLLSVDFVIVSGSLLNVSAADQVGPFLQRLRMDSVDLEWCFRAWDRGYSIWMDEGVRLPHRVGTGLVRAGPIAFPRQNPARMANYVRSQAMLIRMSHVPLRWKLRSLAYVPLQVALYALKSSTPFSHLRLLVSAAAYGLAEHGRKESSH